MMVKKEDENYLNSLLKSFKAWMAGEIYCVSIYEPKYYSSEE
jgi:hypothetical protein